MNNKNTVPQLFAVLAALVVLLVMLVGNGFFTSAVDQAFTTKSSASRNVAALSSSKAGLTGITPKTGDGEETGTDPADKVDNKAKAEVVLYDYSEVTNMKIALVNCSSNCNYLTTERFIFKIPNFLDYIIGSTKTFTDPEDGHDSVGMKIVASWSNTDSRPNRECRDLPDNNSWEYDYRLIPPYKTTNCVGDISQLYSGVEITFLSKAKQANASRSYTTSTYSRPDPDTGIRTKIDNRLVAETTLSKSALFFSGGIPGQKYIIKYLVSANSVALKSYESDGSPVFSDEELRCSNIYINGVSDIRDKLFCVVKSSIVAGTSPQFVDVTPIVSGSGTSSYTYNVYALYNPDLVRPEETPTASSISTPSAKTGSDVEVSGSKFSTNNDNFVQFTSGNKSYQVSSIQSMNGNKLKIKIPSSLPAGTYSLKISTPTSDWSNSIPLTVTAAGAPVTTSPVITSFTSSNAYMIIGSNKTFTLSWTATNASSCWLSDTGSSKTLPIISTVTVSYTHLTLPTKRIV